MVERKDQHLLNIARALYFQSKVPISFWGNCINTAPFLSNRVFSPLLKFSTAYQLFFGKLPPYDALRVFGFFCYASTLPAHRTKFSLRAMAAMFVGYPVGYKGYKLYNLETRQFFINRDVKFYESVFLFHKDVHDQPLPELFVDAIIPAAPHDDAAPIALERLEQPDVVPLVPK